MFTLDKLNLADFRLLFPAVNFKVNLGESLRIEEFLSIPPLSRKSTYLELSEQLTVKLNLKCFEYVAPKCTKLQRDVTRNFALIGIWPKWREAEGKFQWNCSVSYLSFVYGSSGGVCGRSLSAGKILFTGRQTCSLYLEL